jgi:MtN3 and saliva related transmembrane protein
MDKVTLIGLLGGVLTTSSFLPQVVQTWKTKSTADISLGMFLTLDLGILCWAIYGFLINSFPVIAANMVSLILALIITGLKIKYK